MTNQAQGEPGDYVLHCTASTLAEHLRATQDAIIEWPDAEKNPHNFIATMGSLAVIVRVEPW